MEGSPSRLLLDRDRGMMMMMMPRFFDCVSLSLCVVCGNGRLKNREHTQKTFLHKPLGCPDTLETHQACPSHPKPLQTLIIARRLADTRKPGRRATAMPHNTTHKHSLHPSPIHIHSNAGLRGGLPPAASGAAGGQHPAHDQHSQHGRRPDGAVPRHLDPARPASLERGPPPTPAWVGCY